jgi:hypothetical protein
LGNVRDVQLGSTTEHSSRWELFLSHTTPFERDYLRRAIACARVILEIEAKLYARLTDVPAVCRKAEKAKIP